MTDTPKINTEPRAREECLEKPITNHDTPMPDDELREKSQDFAVLYIQAIDDDDYEQAEKLTVKHLALIRSKERAAALQAVRADRKANAEFWKGKIDRLFDKEIATYAELNKLKEEN